MGNGASRWFWRYWTRDERRVLLVGLDAAGKTTVLHQLCSGKKVSTLPTLEFNVRTMHKAKFKLMIWDVGGQDALRPLWRHHYTGTQGLVFVVDSSDRERLELVEKELENLLIDPQVEKACLLILLNKRDLAGAMSVEELTEALCIDQRCKEANRPYQVVSTVATTGEGLDEGMTWLCETMREV